MPQAEGMREADITISGVPLTFAQSLAVRVAVSMFQMQLNTPGFAEDLGPVANNYRDRLNEVITLIGMTAR